MFRHAWSYSLSPTPPPFTSPSPPTRQASRVPRDLANGDTDGSKLLLPLADDATARILAYVPSSMRVDIQARVPFLLLKEGMVDVLFVGILHSPKVLVRNLWRIFETSSIDEGRSNLRTIFERPSTDLRTTFESLTECYEGYRKFFMKILAPSSKGHGR